MHFDLTDLRLFVQVAESKSLTKGAERSHLSLPAVSARVKEMEKQAGVRLLYRAPRGVALTPAGQSLLQHARILLAQIENLKGDLQRFGEGVKGHIRIFANTTAVTEFMPEVLATFLARHPQVDVDLQERLTGEIIRGVLDGTTDLGIVSGPINADGLELHHFSTDRLVLAVALDHPLAKAKRPEKLRFADALAYDFIGLHEGSTLQTFLNRLLRDANRRLRIRIQVSNFEALCRMVEAGVGIGVVPESAALRHSRTMRLVLREFDEPWAVRERYILTRHGEALPAFTQALIDTILHFGGGVGGGPVSPLPEAGRSGVGKPRAKRAKAAS